MTADPLVCHHAPHPSVPNVRDLTAERDALVNTVAALVRDRDRLCRELAKSRGVPEMAERLRHGLPVGQEVGVGGTPGGTGAPNVSEPAPVTPVGFEARRSQIPEGTA